MRCPVDLVVCDVVAVWVVQPSIVTHIGVMLGFAILGWVIVMGECCWVCVPCGGW